MLLKIARITSATLLNFVINGQYEPPSLQVILFRFLSTDKVSLFNNVENTHFRMEQQCVAFSSPKIPSLILFWLLTLAFRFILFSVHFLLNIIQFESRSVSHLATYSHQIDKIQYVFTAIQFHFVMFLFSHFQYYVCALVL